MGMLPIAMKMSTEPPFHYPHIIYTPNLSLARMSPNIVKIGPFLNG